MRAFFRGTSAVSTSSLLKASKQPFRSSTVQKHVGSRSNSRSKSTSCKVNCTALSPKSCSDALDATQPKTVKSCATPGFTHRSLHATKPTAARATIALDGKQAEFSPVLLRDLCQCPACVHEDTRQRLYSAADIPADIQARSVETVDGTVNIQWKNDIASFGSDHTTRLSVEALRQVSAAGSTPGPFQGATPRHELWSGNCDELPDYSYEEYMKDDAVVYDVVKQLKTHGLVFVTGCPGVEESVAAVGERIGPVRDTFYGRTWDVRTVPKAINAAYTSGDLGFHTDLLYFQDPPHLQLLHCIQSSSTGGASVFADAFKAALDLYDTDQNAFNILLNTPVTYHYEHPGANLYAATKPVFDTIPLRIGITTYETLAEFLEAWEVNRQKANEAHGTSIPALTVGDCLQKINWGPPFLAPPSLDPHSMEQTQHLSVPTAREALSDKVDMWHNAAAKFSVLLNRPENLHERLMKPGECVIFDNTRTLHGRKAFDSSDVGKARWLRGTYVDRDPYYSKLRVLRHQFGSEVELTAQG